MRTYRQNQVNAGFTLVELIVAIAVFSVVVVGLSSLISGVFTVNRQQGSLLASQDEVRKLTFMVMSEVRNATTSSAGAYAIELAGNQEVVFYANIDAGSEVERVRYYLQNGKIYKGVVKPAGSPLVYNLANEQVSVVQSGIVGNPTIFNYFDDTYNGVTGVPLVQPVSVTQVRLVQMNVPLKNTAGLLGANSFTVTAQATVRSLKTNLAATPPPPPTPPTMDLLVNGGNGPVTINYSATASLTWSSANATGCVASGAWSGSLGVSGTQSTGALTTSVTYTLTCTGSGGSVQDSVTVNVNPPPLPTVDLQGNGSGGSVSISYNASVTLTWSSTTTTSCTASGAWSGSQPLSGGWTSGALTTDQTYTLDCTGPGGSASDSVVVNVGAPPPTPPTCTSASPQSGTVSGNGNFTVYAYGVQNTTSLYFHIYKSGSSINVTGVNQGNGTWLGTFSLGSIPSKGWYTVDVHVTNANYSNVLCASTQFRRK